MRLAPSRIRRQRALLDARLKKLRSLAADSSLPRNGWVRAIREALGMSAAQLGARLGVTKQAVREIENGEVDRRISLKTLDRSAQALGCRVVYLLIPEDTLEGRVDARARAVATKQLARVRHSMALESQEPARQLHELQIKELAEELKAKRSHELWDDET